MTRERAKELLPVMQAFADGKEIQYRVRRDGEQWQDVPTTLTTLPFIDDLDYRIKPKERKREWWFLEFEDGSSSHLVSSRSFAEAIKGDYGTKIVHVKEVE